MRYQGKFHATEVSEVWKREDQVEERAWKSDGSCVSFAVQAN